MNITLEADYAVRIIDFLAKKNTRTGASEIARMTGVTTRFTLKILHKLTACKIVVSYKGAKGGYELAKPAGEITLREVIETVEGPYTFSRCLNPDHSCNCGSEACQSGGCRFQRVYDDISKVVREKLGSVTFDRDVT